MRVWRLIAGGELRQYGGPRQVPAFFWGGELPNKAAVQTGFNQWRSTIDGSFYWGIAGVPGGTPDQLPSSEAYASVVHGGDKLYMAPVTLQFWGANANRYYEYSGFSGMRKMWMDAINVTHPDWVEIITWNDFVEGTYVSPIDDRNKYQFANFLFVPGVPLFTLNYFHSHYAATDLLPYFIKWYKTGERPRITRDAVYFALPNVASKLRRRHPAGAEQIRSGRGRDLHHCQPDRAGNAEGGRRRPVEADQPA